MYNENNFAQKVFNKVLNESCFVNNLLKQKAYKGLYLFICWRFKKMGIVFWFGGFGL